MRFGRYEWMSLAFALAVLVFDLQIPLGVACGILYTGVVLVAQFTGRPRFIYAMALLGSFLTVIGYFGSPPGEAVHWMVLTNRALSIYVIWLTAWLTIKALQQHRQEVQSLTELLPICAWCKQIRDDKGYWTHLESYLKQHADLDFSHSICPACMKKQLEPPV